MSASRRFMRQKARSTNANGTPHDLLVRFARGRYYSRFWFLCDPQQPLDVFCVLERQLPDGLWKFQYRFRYYNDDKAFDSSDRKNFYSGQFDEVQTEEEVVAKLEEAVAAIAEVQGLGVDCLVVQSDDPDVIMPALMSKPYFRSRTDDTGVLQ